MRHLTLRVPDELADRLKATASNHEDSVNGYAVKVLSAAVDPDLAGDEITGLRERLACFDADLRRAAGREGFTLVPETVGL